MNQKTEIIPIIGDEFSKIVIPEIKNAKNSIKIIVFDWRWYPTQIGNPAQQFNQEIINAHRRGVEVLAITNIKETRRILNEAKIKAKNLISARILHPKIMIIDNQHLIIGSHNYTQNAFTTNYEASILIKNCPNIERYIQFFKNLY